MQICPKLAKVIGFFPKLSQNGPLTFIETFLVLLTPIDKMAHCDIVKYDFIYKSAYYQLSIQTRNV